MVNESRLELGLATLVNGENTWNMLEHVGTCWNMEIYGRHAKICQNMPSCMVKKRFFTSIFTTRSKAGGSSGPNLSQISSRTRSVTWQFPKGFPPVQMFSHEPEKSGQSCRSWCIGHLHRFIMIHRSVLFCTSANGDGILGETPATAKHGS